jgi:hypothetical protein
VFADIPAQVCISYKDSNSMHLYGISGSSLRHAVSMSDRMANVSANQGDILWMVIRMDLHGTKFLIKDGLNEPAATRYLDDLKRSHRKVHGQDYSILSYRRCERAAAIADHGIVI